MTSSQNPYIKNLASATIRRHYLWRLTHFAIRFFLSVVLFAACHSIQANGDTGAMADLKLPTATLIEGSEISFTSVGAYLRDSDNELSVEHILDQTSWHKSQVENLNLGYSKAGYWLAAKVQASNIETQWMLRSRYALFDQFDMYLCPTASPLRSEDCYFKQMGDRIPFRHRDFDHPEFTAYLPFQNTQPHWLIIKTSTEGSFPMMIKLADKRTTIDDLVLNFGLRGGYISMMLVMGLYNLFLFTSIRDRSYFYYSAFVLSFLAFHLTYSGGLFQFVWPDQPDINGYALPLAFSINLIFMSLFISHFLNLQEHGRASYLLFRVYLLISFVLLFSNGLLPYQTVTKLNNILAIVMGLSGIVVGFRFWFAGVYSAPFFTVAWIAFIVGLILASARSFGLITLNIYTLYGYQIGSLIEILLLSLALGQRISQLQKDKKEGQLALLETQKESIKNLKNFEDIYNNSIIGQFQLDKDLHIIKANPAFLNMLNTEPAPLVSKSVTFNDLLGVTEEREAFWRVAHGDLFVRNHEMHLTPLDQSKPVVASINMRKGLDGEDAYWIGSAQDITEKFEQEQALIDAQQERTQSLKQLVMGIAHEMNTPLGNIKMAQTFIHDGLPHVSDDHRPFMKEGLSIIEQGTESLSELGLLMKSAAVVDQEWRVESLDLVQWMNDWRAFVIRKHGETHINIQTDLTNNQKTLCYLALHEVLTQLAWNSIFHNMDLKSENTLKIDIIIKSIGNHLQIHYADNGKGIDQETKTTIFQPFYTTQRQDAKNKGLGLYQTYNLITEVLKGKISWPEGQSGFVMVIEI